MSSLLVHSVLLDDNWLKLRFGTPRKQLMALKIAEVLHAFVFLLQFGLKSSLPLLFWLIFLYEIIHSFLMQFFLEEFYRSIVGHPHHLVSEVEVAPCLDQLHQLHLDLCQCVNDIRFVVFDFGLGEYVINVLFEFQQVFFTCSRI